MYIYMKSILFRDRVDINKLERKKINMTLYTFGNKDNKTEEKELLIKKEEIVKKKYNIIV